jgi:hypothetical protein
MAALFIIRNPLSVARSMEARDGVPVTLGLAVWDRHMRSAAEVLEGLPTFVVDYDDMMANPTGTTDEIVGFLGQVGIEVPPGVAEAATHHLDSGLHHQRAEADQYQDLAQVQLQIFDALRERSGFHAAWEQPPAFLPAPLWVEDALRLRRIFKKKVRELKTLRSSKANRISMKLARLTGRSARVPQNA